ncbi:hypothetical protein K3495_g8568 [Podosphaera aphanis]|nr:hypothetical protein K3495_g8568 [Podosphaera aphanis]
MNPNDSAFYFTTLAFGAEKTTDPWQEQTTSHRARKRGD